MLTNDELASVVGADLRDPDGDKIGSIQQVYVDNVSGTADWVTVSTGFFGTKVSFVPLTNASWDGDGVRVPYSKSDVKDAPAIEADGSLSHEEERDLYRHYGLGQNADTGHEVSMPLDSDGGATAPAADDAMIRSEERLVVGTRQEETGRVRLRKYIVTEQQTVTVPVTHEEVRVEREPITEANRDESLRALEMSEDEQEIVLHRDVPVVTTETEAVERVRLATETITDTEDVTGEVRAEHVEVEGDAPGQPEGDRTST